MQPYGLAQIFYLVRYKFDADAWIRINTSLAGNNNFIRYWITINSISFGPLWIYCYLIHSFMSDIICKLKLFLLEHRWISIIEVHDPYINRSFTCSTWCASYIQSAQVLEFSPNSCRHCVSLFVAYFSGHGQQSM